MLWNAYNLLSILVHIHIWVWVWFLVILTILVWVYSLKLISYCAIISLGWILPSYTVFQLNIFCQKVRISPSFPRIPSSKNRILGKEGEILTFWQKIFSRNTVYDGRIHPKEMIAQQFSMNTEFWVITKTYYFLN